MATGFINATTASTDGSVINGSIYIVDSATGGKLRYLVGTEWASYAAQGYSFSTASGDAIRALITLNGLGN